MKVLICLGIIFFCLGFTKKKKNISYNKTCYYEDTSDFAKKAIEFIKEVTNISSLDSNIVLRDKPSNFDSYNFCKKNLFQDTSLFTKGELNYILQKNYPKISLWTMSNFPGVKLISSDTIEKIFSKAGGGWDFFNKNIAESFRTFSTPIFFRNYTYCLFYSDLHCGWLCGRGRLVLYKLNSNEWKEVKTFCNWIS